MKLANIPITDPAAKRVYNSYIKRVQHSIKALPKEEQTDVLMEWNSHIFESMQRSNASEMESLLDVTEKLGEPEKVLKALVADKKMDQAVRSFNPVHMAKALALNIGNGIAYIIFALLYLLLFTFVFLIIMKLIYPSEIGMFYKNDSFVLGWVNNKDNFTELLGHWFIPAMILASVIFYFIITLGIKLKRKLNNKKS